MRIWIVVGLLLSFGSSNSSAQNPVNDSLLLNDLPRIYLGPVGGYNRVSYSSGFQSLGRDVYLPYFTDGKAEGFYAGISAEYLLRRPGGCRSSILVRIVYNSLPASYHASGGRVPAVDANRNVVYSKVQYAAEIAYSRIDLDILFKFDLFDSGFGFTVGPVIGIPVMVSRVQRMELVDTLDTRLDPSLFPLGSVEYIDDGRGVVAGRDDVPGHTGLRMAFKVGVQYDIPFGNMLVIPSVSYNIGLADMSPFANLGVNALQTGVDLHFAL